MTCFFVRLPNRSENPVGYQSAVIRNDSDIAGKHRQFPARGMADRKLYDGMLDVRRQLCSAASNGYGNDPSCARRIVN